ncbi:hypothetical protein [Insolitispirillum peregrinum]
MFYAVFIKYIINNLFVCDVIQSSFLLRLFWLENWLQRIKDILRAETLPGSASGGGWQIVPGTARQAAARLTDKGADGFSS